VLRAQPAGTVPACVHAAQAGELRLRGCFRGPCGALTLSDRRYGQQEQRLSGLVVAPSAPPLPPAAARPTRRHPPPPLLCLVTQECTVVLLDVGPRMHPHVEYAARAVSDFLMSKVGWAGVAAV
jgi:hypothetical protein